MPRSRTKLCPRRSTPPGKSSMAPRGDGGDQTRSAWRIGTLVTPDTTSGYARADHPGRSALDCAGDRRRRREPGASMTVSIATGWWPASSTHRPSRLLNCMTPRDAGDDVVAQPALYPDGVRQRLTVSHRTITPIGDLFPRFRATAFAAGLFGDAGHHDLPGKYGGDARWWATPFVMSTPAASMPSSSGRRP